MQIALARWTLEVDAEATRDAYAKLGDAARARCGCNTCLNCRALGLDAFPQSFRNFAITAGVDLRYPSEVYYNARLPNGLHSYGGWFHLVGRVLSGRSGWRAMSPTSAEADFEEIDPRLRIGFSTEEQLVPPEFQHCDIVQLDFEAHVRWVLPEAEPV